MYSILCINRSKPRILFLLCFILAGSSPFLKANPSGLGACRSVNLIDDSFDRLSHLWWGYADCVYTSWHMQDTPVVRDLFIHRLIVLNVQPPLFYGEFTGNVINDPPFIGLAENPTAEDVGGGCDKSTNSDPACGDKGSLGDRVEIGKDIHDLGRFVWLVSCFCVGFFFIGIPLGHVIGMWVSDVLWGDNF